MDKSKKLVQTPKPLPDLDGFPPSQQPNEQQEPHIRKSLGPPPAPPRQQQIPIIKSSDSALVTPAASRAPKKEFKLPKIQAPPPREEIQQPKTQEPAHENDMKEFEEAINKINIQMVHTEAPEPAPPTQPATPTPTEPIKEEPSSASEYYKPEELGEGYFSEIEHYIKHKNIHEIMDDIIKKDFLKNMKGYHQAKEEGKPFYLHEKDLMHKLKKKLNQLRKQEQEWHSLKEDIMQKKAKKQELENTISQDSKELKELFIQVKLNHVFEQEAPKEHYFKLASGQQLKSVNDLRKALAYIKDDEFKAHVNEEKNDFAIWVREALQNQDLYEQIKDKKTKEELQETLNNPF